MVGWSTPPRLPSPHNPASRGRRQHLLRLQLPIRDLGEHWLLRERRHHECATQLHPPTRHSITPTRPPAPPPPTNPPQHHHHAPAAAPPTNFPSGPSPPLPSWVQLAIGHCDLIGLSRPSRAVYLIVDIDGFEYLVLTLDKPLTHPGGTRPSPPAPSPHPNPKRAPLTQSRHSQPKARTPTNARSPKPQSRARTPNPKL